MSRGAPLGCAIIAVLLPSLPARAEEVPAGHSLHGEAFNEGPRQRAYLMGGTGKVHLAVTTRNPEAQAFFDQGVGQLHGFWYFEAERSFRQVAFLDPDCAMAYWGMAMANVNNVKRAQGFVQKAIAHEAKASPREQRWIDIYAAYWQGKKDEKERRQELVRALEDLSHDFPDELEAKAFLLFQMWDNRGKGVPIGSRLAMEALIKDVFAAQPMHPAHHYQIHLWDDSKPVRALASAARCGQAAPNIAHMWHMPGHTYSHVHRYADAIWQQEASARVDHRHMMHDRILPDQIHNYAHNNQWLVENLDYVGRVHDAIALAKNLIELPRHPRYNTLGVQDDGTPYGRNRGSAAEGRRRLLEVLVNYEMWDELLALSETMYLEPTDVPEEQAKRLRGRGLAFFGKGDVDKGRHEIEALEGLLKDVRSRRQAAADEAEAKARKEKKPSEQVVKAMAEALEKFSSRLTPIENALTELCCHLALSQKDVAKASDLLKEASDIPKDRLARLWLQLGDADKAEQLAREAVEAGPEQVQPLANYVDILHRRGKLVEAQKQFGELRDLSAEIDLDVPVMRRLAPVAQALQLPADWRVAKHVAPDVGDRPNLADLGPLYWQPTAAPDWSLPDANGRRLGLKDYRGRPVIVIFFLGNGCPHCVEQLNAFEPFVPQFTAAGIALVAVSTDSPEGLKKTFEKTKLSAEFPLAADPDLRVFRSYRAFDDFENKPLHGTFLIDGDGRVRWQDVSYEPFREVRFLLEESKRLLGLSKSAPAAAAAAGR
jgi:peroxiredoxin/tetratricopeptide (TPR) repeat protein